MLLSRLVLRLDAATVRLVRELYRADLDTFGYDWPANPGESPVR